jgi:hypothetical protein
MQYFPLQVFKVEAALIINLTAFLSLLKVEGQIIMELQVLPLQVIQT